MLSSRLNAGTQNLAYNNLGFLVATIIYSVLCNCGKELLSLKFGVVKLFIPDSNCQVGWYS